MRVTRFKIHCIITVRKVLYRNQPEILDKCNLSRKYLPTTRLNNLEPARVARPSPPPSQPSAPQTQKKSKGKVSQWPLLLLLLVTPSLLLLRLPLSSPPLPPLLPPLLLRLLLVKVLLQLLGRGARQIDRDHLDAREVGEVGFFVLGLVVGRHFGCCLKGLGLTGGCG